MREADVHHLDNCNMRLHLPETSCGSHARRLSRECEMKFAKTVRDTPKSAGARTKTLVPSWRLAALVVVCSLSACSLLAYAQTPADQTNTPAPPPNPDVLSPESPLGPVRLKSLPRNLFLDQKSFWTTPFHMTRAEWEWTVPRKTRSDQPDDGLTCGYIFQCRARCFCRCRRRAVRVGAPLAQR
jgi:hypothetical protein